MITKTPKPNDKLTSITKKPVYNGYEEKYISGANLKEYFDGKYYSTGRHHSVILDLMISEYLTFLNIKNENLYRIFINSHFCRIMDGNNDKLISFFGYSDLENIKFYKNPKRIVLKNICPKCNSSMKLKKGKFGEFLGCSNYPNCIYLINIPKIGTYV